jgi:hypothetical protein
MQYDKGQINAVWIHDNDISFNDRGIIFFGNNVIIEKNTIQANNRFAIALGDDVLNTQKFCFGSSVKNNYFELNSSSVSSNASVIGIYTGYNSSTNSTNRICRMLEISNNYFGENGSKYSSFIYVHDLKTSDPSNKNCVLITKNNYGDLPLLSFNKNTALSEGCVIDENYFALVPSTMINTLPVWVEVRGMVASTTYLSTQLATKASVVQSAWIPVTLSNNWVNFGGATAPASYRKNTVNETKLKGLIKLGTVTTGTLLFTLPVGYRPKEQLFFSVYSNLATGGITILPDGQVQVLYGSSVSLSLNGISFLAEQ